MIRIMESEDLLFRKYVVDILTYIRDNPGCKVNDLKELLGSSVKVNNVNNELIGLGLVQFEHGLLYNTKYLSLTANGELVLGYISKI